ncbi:hypothetical protein EV714DRAFT_268226 [Schizophyllum commune]
MSAPPKARRVSRHLEITSPQDDSRAAQGDRSASQDDVYRTETAEDEARDTDELRNARRSDEQDQYQHHDDELTGPSRRSARLDGDLRGTRRLGTSYATLDAPDEQVGARRSTANGLPVPALSSLDALASPERDPTLMMTRSVSPSRSQRRATLAADTAPLHDDGNTEISLDEIF